MSVEGQVLGACTVAGGCGGAATLANTGNPVVIAVAVGFAMIVILGFVSRAAQKQR
jgi:LPXTG-motif cell wall-anchored protein